MSAHKPGTWAGGMQSGMGSDLLDRVRTSTGNCPTIKSQQRQCSLDATSRLLLAGNLMLLVCQNMLKRSSRALQKPEALCNFTRLVSLWRLQCQGRCSGSTGAQHAWPNATSGITARQSAYRMRSAPRISSIRKNTALSPCGTCVADRDQWPCFQASLNNAPQCTAGRGPAWRNNGKHLSASHLDERVLHKALGAGHRQLKHGRLLPGGAAHATLDAHLHVLSGLGTQHAGSSSWLCATFAGQGCPALGFARLLPRPPGMHQCPPAWHANPSCAARYMAGQERQARHPHSGEPHLCELGRDNWIGHGGDHFE